MAKECFHREVDDVGRLLITEDEDLVGWALDGVVGKQLVQQFETQLRFLLSFKHPLEHKVEDG